MRASLLASVAKVPLNKTLRQYTWLPKAPGMLTTLCVCIWMGAMHRIHFISVYRTIKYVASVLLTHQMYL